MEENDRPTNLWKLVSIVLILLVLAFGGHKGYQWTVAEYNARIEAEVAERLDAYRRECVVQGRATQFELDEKLMRKIGLASYVAGYYEGKLGTECAAATVSFPQYYEETKKYLPDCDYAAIIDCLPRNERPYTVEDFKRKFGLD